MAIEKSWAAVPPQLFTANGTTAGVVTIANTAGFKVKQVVTIANGVPSTQEIQVQVRRVLSPGQLIVGPIPQSLQPPYKQEGASLLSRRVDISAYTVAAGAYIYAGELPKVILPIPDIAQAVYEQEPTCAIRTTGVDQYGNFYTDTNPFPVAFDGTISIGDVSIVEGGNTMTVNNDGSINVDATIENPIEIKGTTGNILTVNADGSINVNVVETPVSGQTVKSIYNQVVNIASGVETTLVTYTVPVGYTAVLERASVSGENIARYDILYNSALFDTRRTMFGGDLTSDFDYTTGTSNGFVLQAGDTLIVQVLHNRPYVGTFNARLQVLEIA